MEKKSARMYYLDNLRLSFTFLVILHHVCLTFTGEAGWYYYDKIQDPFTNLVMTLLMTINRNWVLACFFLISGYFTPGSLDKKGLGVYLKERFLRIGVPLAIFAVFIRPLIFYFLNYRALSIETYFLTGLFLNDIAPGPAWFLEVLLIFSIFYGLWWKLRKTVISRPPKTLSFPTAGVIFLFISILACCTFVFRIYFPHQKQIFHLRLGNYADYVTFFALGICAYRYKWIEKLTDAVGRQWTVINVIATFIYAMFVIPAWYGNESLAFLRGGYSLKTFMATYVGTTIAVGSSISFIYLFRTFFNYQPGIVKSLVRDAYAVFIFHAPILIWVTYMIEPLTLFPFVKFLLVFFGTSAICFLSCRYIVRNIPYSNRIL